MFSLYETALLLVNVRLDKAFDEQRIENRMGKVRLAVDEDGVSKILSTIAHPLRRDILNFISEKNEVTFTDLLNALQIDTGKLSFHLRTLSSFLEQTPAGKYKLNRAGESAVKVVRDVASWAEVADVRRKADELPLASFKKRTYAFLIDFLMMLAITSTLVLPGVLLPQFGDLLGLVLSAVLFVALVLLFAYSTLLEGFIGQTVGKRVIGLKVVRIDGKKLSYDHAAVRNFGKAFLLPFDLLVGLKHERFLRYFDRFAGTTVIDLRL